MNGKEGIFLDYREYKSLRKRKHRQDQKEQDIAKKKFLRFTSQVLLSAILLLATLIVIKIDIKTKDVIYKEVYEKSFQFAVVNDLYQTYFGHVFPIKKAEKVTAVFNERMTYEEASIYKDGVKLKVAPSYLVPFLESGIVVFMGEKEGYGNTIIVQQVNGMDVWYGNVVLKDIKMYDYVEKGSLLGECNSDTLYMVFQKEGSFLDYKDYLS